MFPLYYFFLYPATYDNPSFSKFYLDHLDRDIFDLVSSVNKCNNYVAHSQEQVSSFGRGEDKIRDGDAWATLLFEKNYTENVVQRYNDIIKWLTMVDLVVHNKTHDIT